MTFHGELAPMQVMTDAPTQTCKHILGLFSSKSVPHLSCALALSLLVMCGRHLKTRMMRRACCTADGTRCNLYMFASSMLYVNIQAALDYWYTADEACAPHGPHFNYVLYVTVAHVMASVASLVGIFVFLLASSRQALQMFTTPLSPFSLNLC